MNGDGDDAESVDLLASDADSSTVDPRLLYPPPRRNETNATNDVRPAKRSKVAHSPATQTINALSQSQQMADLHYDKLSQLEYDVVRALVQTKDAHPTELPRKEPTDPQRDATATKTGPIRQRPPVNPQGVSSLAAPPSSPIRWEKSDPDRISAPRRTTTGRPDHCGRSFRYSETPRQALETKRIQQIDVSTGEVLETFPSYTAASKKTGIGRKVISSIVKGQLESKNGWTFRLENAVSPDVVNSESLDNHTASPIKCKASTDQREEDGKISTTKRVHKKTESRMASSSAVITRISNGAIAVEELDANTGAVLRTYPSLTLAAMESGASRHMISAILKGQSKSWKGLKWRYATGTTTMSTSCAKSTNHDSNDSSDSDAPQKYNDRVKNDVKVKIHEGLPAACDKESQKKTKYAPTATRNAQIDCEPDKCEKHSLKDPRTIALDAVRLKDEDDQTSVINSCGYSFHVITITDPGSLGIKVKKVKTPEGAFNFPFWLPKDKHESDFSLQVDSLLGDDCLASSLGIQAADYLLLSCEDDSPLRIVSQQDVYDNCFDSVVEAIKSGNRPTTLFAIRLKSNVVPAKCDDKSNEIIMFENDISDDSSGAASKKSQPSSTSNEIKSTDEKNRALDLTARKTCIKVRETEDLRDGCILSDERHRGNSHDDVLGSAAPFCALCSGQKTSRLVHHAWCPKNEHYLSSGADSIVSRILHGIKVLNCCGCREEYQSGRRVANKNHSASCRVVQKSLCSQNADPSEEPQPNHCASIRDSQSVCRSPCHDDDNDSAYASPSKSRGRIHVLKVASASDMLKSHRSTIVPLATSQPVVRTLKDSKVRSHTTQTTSNPKKTRQSPLGKSVKISDRICMDAPAYSKSGPVEIAVSDREDTEAFEKLNVAWENCENVWGPDEHMDDDVVVFTSSTSDACHYESFFVSHRYEIDPFRSYPRYYKTHSSPEEGYQALRLRRDLLATRPWGFSCERHEFGGACLVSAVDPLSPAEAAVRCRGRCFSHLDSVESNFVFFCRCRHW
jgi:hypothetical protein